MLVRRRRRWTNIKPTLVQRILQGYVSGEGATRDGVDEAQHSDK